MKEKKKLSLATQIFIGLGLGIIAGIIFMLAGKADWASAYVKPFGTIFLNLLKFIVVPIVLSSIIMGVISMQDIRKVGSIGLKTVIYYLLTTACAVIIGLVFANIFKGTYQLLETSGLSYEAAESAGFMNTLVEIFPSNIIQPLANATMLQVIVIAIFIGFGIIIAGEKGKVLGNVVDSINEVCMVIMDMILKLSDMRYRGANALVVRKAEITNRQSTFAELSGAIRRIFGADADRYWRARQEPMELECLVTGARIVFRGMKDDTQREKLKSVSFPAGKLCFIWLEEATEFSPSDLEVLDDRLRGDLSAVNPALYYQITLTFNPVSADHWLKKRFFDAPADGDVPRRAARHHVQRPDLPSPGERLDLDRGVEVPVREEPFRVPALADGLADRLVDDPADLGLDRTRQAERHADRQGCLFHF